MDNLSVAEYNHLEGKDNTDGGLDAAAQGSSKQLRIQGGGNQAESIAAPNHKSGFRRGAC